MNPPLTSTSVHFHFYLWCWLFVRSAVFVLSQSHSSDQPMLAQSLKFHIVCSDIADRYMVNNLPMGVFCHTGLWPHFATFPKLGIKTPLCLVQLQRGLLTPQISSFSPIIKSLSTQSSRLKPLKKLLPLPWSSLGAARRLNYSFRG